MHDALLANPPHHIYAYILSRTIGKRNLLGVAVDTKTGKTLESVVLPTKQRVMLALGIGNDEAQAHRTYARMTGNNYTLTWTDAPEREASLLEMSERLKRLSVGIQRAIQNPQLTEQARANVLREELSKHTPDETLGSIDNDVREHIVAQERALAAKAAEIEQRERETFTKQFVAASTAH